MLALLDDCHVKAAKWPFLAKTVSATRVGCCPSRQPNGRTKYGQSPILSSLIEARVIYYLAQIFISSFSLIHSATTSTTVFDNSIDYSVNETQRVHNHKQVPLIVFVSSKKRPLIRLAPTAQAFCNVIDNESGRLHALWRTRSDTDPLIFGPIAQKG